MMTKFGLRTAGLSKGEIRLFPFKLPLLPSFQRRMSGATVQS